MTAGGMAGRRHWKLDELPWDAICVERVRPDEQLFFLLVSASFVEILSELYTGNLARWFGEDSDAARWLRETWQHEEVQHGLALRAYVKAVWPEFDWQVAYEGFAAEYGPMCNDSELEDSRALEFAARCVVETGTSSLYRFLHDAVDEPVLRQLLANIKADEVRHYSQFLKMFRRYNREEGLGSLAVLRALLRRVREGRNEDAEIAFRHAWQGRHPGQPCPPRAWEEFNFRANAMARRHFPFRMAARMLLEPVPVPGRLRRLAAVPLSLGMRLVLR